MRAGVGGVCDVIGHVRIDRSGRGERSGERMRTRTKKEKIIKLTLDTRMFACVYVCVCST